MNGSASASANIESDDALGTIARAFARHSHELVAFLRGRRGAHDAEDLVQESFARLIEAHRSQPVEQPRAWLYKTGCHLAYDAHDHQRVVDAVVVDGAPTETVPDTLADPQRRVAAREQLDRAWQALEALPDAVRHAFLLNRFEALSQREIAARLGVSEKTIERHVLRALKACHDALR